MAAFGAAHDDVPILNAGIDLKLDEHGYFVRDLGGAGDRRARSSPPPCDLLDLVAAPAQYRPGRDGVVRAHD